MTKDPYSPSKAFGKGLGRNCNKKKLRKSIEKSFDIEETIRILKIFDDVYGTSTTIFKQLSKKSYAKKVRFVTTSYLYDAYIEIPPISMFEITKTDVHTIDITGETYLDTCIEHLRLMYPCTKGYSAIYDGQYCSSNSNPYIVKDIKDECRYIPIVLPKYANNRNVVEICDYIMDAIITDCKNDGFMWSPADLYDDM